MNDLLDTLNDISTSLAILAQQVRAESQAGLGSRNKIAEHVLLPVLRHIYKAPGLVNTNMLAANFPGIDLYDESSGLGVQITSETTAAKITKTIEKLAAGGLPVKRLVIALATGTTPRRNRETQQKWRDMTQGRFALDPEADVFAFDRLLGRIETLPLEQIKEIAGELRALVRGTHAIHLVPHLQHQAQAQLAEEERVARYIPDVFVETQNTKYQARCFAHPTLFLQRIAGWFDREPFAGLNHLLTMSGMAPLTMPPSRDLVNVSTLEETAKASERVIAEIDRIDETLTSYRGLIGTGETAVSRDLDRDYILKETRFYIENSSYSIHFQLDKRRTELRCAAARVFLLTGPAGQGKTNFLCDFTERYLLRHGIPCAYITTRQLSRTGNPNLTEVVRQLVFPAAISSLDEGLTSLAPACAERRQPFVLVIDGLNEHPDVRSFAGQLEHLLEMLVRYPHVRVLMTCRSEFLEERFGKLLNGPLAPVLHLSEAHGRRFDDQHYRDLVRRYFRFFKVRPSRVSAEVIDFLQRDVLLLRFFCEAYGSRNRDSEYKQPNVTGIYRDEIFRRYIEDKMSLAQDTVVSDPAMPSHPVRQSEIRRVLKLVAAHMLEKGWFADVPRSIVPAALDAELTALLDEELILRHDLSPPPSVLAEPTEVLNFTFDEMRDYMLAQHLLAIHTHDPAEFDRLVALQDPTTAQSIEGLQRFLFDASRVPTNEKFYKCYQAHAWYETVYDTEVFAIQPSHLNAEDASIIAAALKEGGSRAQHFTRELALRWQTTAFPVLNLKMLLEVARNEGSQFFKDVIVPTFNNASYSENSLAEAFYNFIETKVLPKFDPDQEHPYDPIFRLLLLLLPINATPTLESPAVDVFHQLVSSHPDYAVSLLREALDDGMPGHRAFLWRILGMAAPAIIDPAPLIAAAEADAGNPRSDTLLSREADWFLSRMSADRSS